MKNIHILPTSKLSRLHTYKGVLNLAAGEFVAPIIVKNDLINQHIYITNSEEIKEGDWVYSKNRNKICKVTGISKWTHKNDYSIDLDNESYFIHHSYCKKIILTTDQDLDGVQPIDDEFLEWFFKNTSCEEVEVGETQPSNCCINKEGKTKMNNGCMERNRCLHYKIIIPKEEPKQETLEEAAHEYFKRGQFGLEKASDTEEAFLRGAKWQHQQSVDFSNINANNITTASTQNQTLWKEMYSEEDMRQSIFTAFLLGVDRGKYSKELEDKLIEQFKKK